MAHEERKPKLRSFRQHKKTAISDVKSRRKGRILPGDALIAGRVGLDLPTQDEDVNLKTAAMIDRALENVELVRRRMANDQIEIDRLRTETRARIAELLT